MTVTDPVKLVHQTKQPRRNACQYQKEEYGPNKRSDDIRGHWLPIILHTEAGSWRLSENSGWNLNSVERGHLFDEFVRTGPIQSNSLEEWTNLSVLGQPPRRLSENIVRSEDGRKLRIKIRFCEENSELFDEQKRIFRPIYCHHSRAVYSQTAS